MKKPSPMLLVIVLIIVIVVVFKGVTLLTGSYRGSATTATLPVQSGNVTITISDMQYHPNHIAIRAGSTITWINNDPEAHTVTQGNRAAPVAHGFDSKLLASGKSWSYTFKDAGTYDYTCLFHPNMNASVVVE